MEPSIKNALVYLPPGDVVQCPRRQVIYDEKQPAVGLYLIVTGSVQVSTTLEGGVHTVVGLYSADDFFGEASLLGGSARRKAIALEHSSLMYWSATEIEEQMKRQPKLGMALIQMLVVRCLDFEDRLQSLVLDNTLQRVERALLRLADQSSQCRSGDPVRIPKITHQLLSEYVGASREIVTVHMNRLRRRGLVRYSCRAMEIFADALKEQLGEPQR